MSLKQRVKATPTDPVDTLKEVAGIGSIFIDDRQPRLAGGDAYHIVSQDYFIGWNKSRAYIQKGDVVNILVKSDSPISENVTSQVLQKNMRDLTREEVDNITKSKPAYNDLLKVGLLRKNGQ